MEEYYEVVVFEVDTILLPSLVLQWMWNNAMFLCKLGFYNPEFEDEPNEYNKI